MSANVVANYVGYHDNVGYLVNVKTAKPTGNMGDAGVIRQFETKEEAKAYADYVNATGVDTFAHQNPIVDTNVRHQGDEFAYSARVDEGVHTEPPSISWGRAVTGFLTKEQVDAINETGRLPKNVKIMPDGYGGYNFVYNYFGLRAGTQTVPAGFEMKQDVIGVAHIVPKDTNGILYR